MGTDDRATLFEALSRTGTNARDANLIMDNMEKLGMAKDADRLAVKLNSVNANIAKMQSALGSQLAIQTYKIGSLEKSMHARMASLEGLMNTEIASLENSVDTNSESVLSRMESLEKVLDAQYEAQQSSDKIIIRLLSILIGLVGPGVALGVISGFTPWP